MTNSSLAKRYTITLENHPAFPAPNQLTILTDHLDLKARREGQLRKDDSLVVAMPEQTFLRDPKGLVKMGKGLRVHAQSPLIRRLLDHIDGYRLMGAYVFDPDSCADGTLPKVAASLRVPIALSMDGAWQADVLLALLEYYLRSPALETPIEPFDSMARAASGTPFKLAAAERERLGVDYFVGRGGEVSLSARWLGKGITFGTVDTPADTFENSEGWQILERLRAQIFTQQLSCAFCPQFGVCEAFFLHSAEDAPPCDAWRQVMERIRAEATACVRANAENSSCPTS